MIATGTTLDPHLHGAVDFGGWVVSGSWVVSALQGIPGLLLPQLPQFALPPPSAPVRIQWLYEKTFVKTSGELLRAIHWKEKKNNEMMLDIIM